MKTMHLSCLPLVCLLLAGVEVRATQFSFAHLLKGAGGETHCFCLFKEERDIQMKLNSIWSGA